MSVLLIFFYFGLVRRFLRIENGFQEHNSLQAILYHCGSLQLLDQRKLPLDGIYLDIRDANDGWFLVDQMSSAHVYLKLNKGQMIDDIPEGVLEDCAQLVKANSIQGNKVNNVDGCWPSWFPQFEDVESVEEDCRGNKF
ncbi:hypothetical protein M9H77_12848 [Catharanthus roseus]|uniref:Uncharacterized protein n=1 Tax=Catharanthus roseus TaxID=4058 RepID=A0ACC0BIH6_CATRO|nr:hypothetical protein M9H77_12848 [Catharanthus roseus]